mgnify:CR=1 FL=1
MTNVSESIHDKTCENVTNGDIFLIALYVGLNKNNKDAKRYDSACWWFEQNSVIFPFTVEQLVIDAINRTP